MLLTLGERVVVEGLFDRLISRLGLRPGIHLQVPRQKPWQDLSIDGDIPVGRGVTREHPPPPETDNHRRETLRPLKGLERVTRRPYLHLENHKDVYNLTFTETVGRLLVQRFSVPDLGLKVSLVHQKPNQIQTKKKNY